MFCSKCGKENISNAIFCRSCGTKILIQESSVSYKNQWLKEKEPMTFGKAIATCMVKYFDFSGRASRAEYWWFNLFNFLLYSLSFIVDPSQKLADLLTLALFFPSVSVSVRRFHDTNRSGWWNLIPLTIIGVIPYFIWLASKGSDKDNQYGTPV